MMSQSRDIFAPVAQRGKFDSEGVQAIVEVVAHASFVDCRLKVAIRRCNQPDVDRYGTGRTTEPLHHALLQHAQKLRLVRQAEVSSLVQKKRSAVRGLDQTFFHGHRASESATLVAEQFAFDKAFAKRRAVDGDERPRCTPAHPVERPRGEFLSASCLSQNEDCRIGWSDQTNALRHRLHGLAAAHKTVELVVYMRFRFHSLKNPSPSSSSI